MTIIVTLEHIDLMVRVGIAELKSELSAYLKKVIAGIPVIITAHGQPIARIHAFNEKEAESFEEKLSSMVSQGIVQYTFKPRLHKNPKRVKLKNVSIAEILSQERSER